MYIDKVPNRTSRPTLLLRESYRQGRRVLKDTILNITHWPPHVVEALRRALKGETLVCADDVFAIQRSLPHGHIEVIMGMIRKTGLDRLIASKRCRERDLVLAMIVKQILEPGSKLAVTRAWHSTSLAEEFGVADAEEDDLYEALDWLLARQKKIEAKLARRHLSPGDLALYDRLKTDLRVRPIFLRTEAHARAHTFLCLLAYFVEWHLRQALAPLLFEEEELQEDRHTRDPVAPARHSPSAKQKKAARKTPEGFPIHSFSALLDEMATRCKNWCRLDNVPDAPLFPRLTDPTPYQEKVYKLLKQYPVEGNGNPR